MKGFLQIFSILIICFSTISEIAKADPKYKEYKDFAENFMCAHLQGREFKVCVKEVIKTQQAAGKSIGEGILDAIEESEPENIIIE